MLRRLFAIFLAASLGAGSLGGEGPEILAKSIDDEGTGGGLPTDRWFET